MPYEDGYKSGLNWPDAWMNHGEPGGPWVPRAGYSVSSGAVHACAMAGNIQWRRGWADGLQEKIRSGRSNPLIGTDENAKFHLISDSRTLPASLTGSPRDSSPRD